MRTQPTSADFHILDHQGKERPESFSLEEATKQVWQCGILDKLAASFGPVGTESEAPSDWGCLIVQWDSIQDATFHTDITVRHWNSASPEDRLSLRLSNFGSLAALSALDTAEPTPEIFSFFQKVCEETGYLLLEENRLYEKWIDQNGKEISAWSRFFQYV